MVYILSAKYVVDFSDNSDKFCLSLLIRQFLMKIVVLESPNHYLLKACEKGNWKEFKRALYEGADMNAKDEV